MPSPVMSPEEPRGSRFNLAEIAEFQRWIEHAPAADLPRHRERLRAALELRCLDRAVADRLWHALQARHQLLKLPDPGPLSAAPATDPNRSSAP
jgi:hypothetical protein